MAARLSIRSSLMLLVAGLAVPFATFVGFDIYGDWQNDVANTKRSLRTLAQVMATNTGGKIAEAQEILQRMAARPAVQAVDAQHCDAALKDLHDLNPGYSNIVYTDLAGRAICSAVAQPGGKPVNVGQTAWFKKVLAEQRFSVGQPHFGPITGKWVTVLSAPIWNADKQMVGAIHLPLDLSSFDPKIPSQNLPLESRYGFFNQEGVLVWRNLDPEKVIGSKPDAEAARRIIEVRDGEVESRSVDGVIRYFSIIPLPEAGWVAFVGVPVESIYGQARERAISSIVLGVLGLLLLVLLARQLARGIERPVAELAEATRGFRLGRPEARAVPNGPKEIVEVADEFNAMVDARLQSERDLRASEKRTVAFLENSAVIAWMKDAEGRWVFASDNFLKRFNLQWEAVKGRTDFELWPEAVAAEFRRTDLEQQVSGESLELIERAVSPAGEESWWLSHKFVFVGEAGQRYVGGLAVDITERQRSERELAQHRVQLEQMVEQRTRELATKNQVLETTLSQLKLAQQQIIHAEKLSSLGALVAGVAHELNTPIGNARTVASTLSEQATDFVREVARDHLRRSSLEQFVQQISEGTRLLDRNLARAADLIHSFKQVAIDQTTSEHRRFNLDVVIADVVAMLQPSFKKSPYHLEVAVDGGIVIDSYPGPLGQVITNLVDNALLHGFRDRVDGVVRISARRDADALELVVEDNGAGIPTAHRERIFDPFFTTRLGQGGSGLGLNVVHNLVTGLFGGEILIDSEEGRGTRLIVRFPLRLPISEAG